MVERVPAGAGEWWKFDRYVLRDGSIRPAEGATLTKYDPWARYDAGPSDSPWLTLFHLVDQLAMQRVSPIASTLTPTGEKLLLDWCAEYGLLGILSHETQEIRNWPRWIPDGSTPGYVGYPDPDILRRMQILYVRYGPEWVQHYLSLGELTLHVPDHPSRPWTPVQEDELPPHMRDADSLAVSIRFDLTTERRVLEPVAEAWIPYFPEIPDNEREKFWYPLPLTEHFWRLYAEPVDKFLSVSMALRDIISVVGQFTDMKTKSRSHLDQVSAALARLNRLFLAQSSTELRPTSDGLRIHSIGPSLLTHLAIMGSFEITRPGSILRRCAVCGRMFSTTSPRMIYCSKTCRHTGQKRQQRQRKKEQHKKEQHSKGEGSHG